MTTLGWNCGKDMGEVRLKYKCIFWISKYGHLEYYYNNIINYNIIVNILVIILVILILYSYNSVIKVLIIIMKNNTLHTRALKYKNSLHDKISHRRIVVKYRIEKLDQSSFSIRW